MPASVILQAAHYVVGHFIVCVNMIKLPNGNFVVKCPVLTPVMRNADAAIISFYHKVLHSLDVSTMHDDPDEYPNKESMW